MAGILGQELLGRSPEWFNVGATEQFMPQSALLAIEFFVVGHFEVKRYQGWNKYKTVSLDDMSRLHCGLHTDGAAVVSPCAIQQRLTQRQQRVSVVIAMAVAVRRAGQLPLRPTGPEQRGHAAAGDQEWSPRYGAHAKLRPCGLLPY